MSWGQPWSELQVREIDRDEHDYQEFKSTPYVENQGEVAPGFVHRLSKQVSAFANGQGGRIFLGVDDAGQIDGGILRNLRKGGFREWLEDVIPGSVDPRLQSFNVFEVLPDDPDESLIGPERAVYVIEIPPSQDAPHQAGDYRYYLRIAGKSRPMGHLHIEDVSRRTRTPRVTVSRVAPFGEPEAILNDPRGPKVQLCFQCFVANEGRVLAQHAGGEFLVPRPLVNRLLRQRMEEDVGAELSQTPGMLHAFRYHHTPIFPGQEVVLLRCWVGLHANNADFVASGAATLGWKIYADDAPVRIGERPLNSYGVVRDALHWLRRHSSVDVQPPRPAPHIELVDDDLSAEDR